MSIPGSLTPLFNSAGAGGYSISRSLRFNSADSAFFSRTPASAGNRKTWTWAGWVKRSKFSQNMPIFGTDYNGASYFTLYFTGGNNFAIENYNASYQLRVQTTQLFRDPSAWFHLVVTLDTTQGTASDRCKIYVNGSQVTALDFNTYPSQNADLLINNNQYHEISTTNSTYTFGGYLADIHFIDGQALDPTSFGEFSATTGVWMPKAYTGSYGTNGFQLKFEDNSNNTATTLGKDTSGNGNNWTPNNLTAFSGGNTNYSTLGSVSTSGSTFGTIANAYDGSPADGAAASGTPWGAIAGTNTQSGLSIAFTSQVKIYYNVNTTGGTISINGNSKSAPVPVNGNTTIGTLTWTTSDISSPFTSLSFTSPNGGVGVYVYGVEVDGSMLIDYNVRGRDLDSLVDVPVNGSEVDTGAGGQVRGNYCTLNPLDNQNITLANGNLDFNRATTAWSNIRGTIGVTSGKWYWEVTASSIGAGSYIMLGIVDSAAFPSGGFHDLAYGYGYFSGDGKKYNSGGGSSYGNTYTSGDVIGIAFDADAGSLFFYKNGTVQNSGTAAYTGLTGRIYFPAFAMYGTTNAVVNFGQRPFAYTAPSGFKALCTANLPAPVVTKPSTVMDVKLYTGNGSTQTISGLEFSPDFVWIKHRNGASYNTLQDIVRGATKDLYSSVTDAEATYANSLNAFNSDGFTVGTGGWVNGSSSTYVAWTWDAGSSTVTNTQGSITSQVRANASAGFSIVTYTGNGTTNATVGHGLGTTPGMVIVKSRSITGNWPVYHRSIGAGNVLFLNVTDAQAAYSNVWGAINPTSSVFTISTSPDTNTTSATYVAYCFAPVAGYSAFGSYTGNGSTDGPFVYTGFRPRWILIKVTNISGESWVMKDSVRGPYNPQDANLYADLSAAEQTANSTRYLDLLSNGFKWRGTEVSVNGNGNTYIYAAFAESPFAYSRAR